MPCAPGDRRPQGRPGCSPSAAPRIDAETSSPSRSCSRRSRAADRQPGDGRGCIASAPARALWRGRGARRRADPPGPAGQGGPGPIDRSSCASGRSIPPRSPSAWPSASRPAPATRTPITGGGRLVGASPELLLSVRSGHGHEPPAGRHPRPSRRPTTTPARLLRSAKDLDEHRLLVEDLAASLATAHSKTSPSPRVPRSSPCARWRTSAPCSTARSGGGPGALEPSPCSQAILPTPAVGGVPRAARMTLIAELEGRRRDYFAGAAGLARRARATREFVPRHPRRRCCAGRASDHARERASSPTRPHRGEATRPARSSPRCSRRSLRWQLAARRP